MPSTPRVISSTELSTSDAKWITLKKLTYVDANGNERPWECAARKTRKSTGIDAVAVLAILRSRTNAFPVSTVVIEQYRPPIDKVIVELPAGLIDEGETPGEAAIRELEEETGYKADGIVEESPVVVTDPGMTNANMKLVIVNVVLPDQMEFPKQKLDAGEFISTRVLELAKLNTELKEYARNGLVVDARLSHFAIGYDLANHIN
ncbi:NUDIX hydrolase domain-like protein [Lyophyllum atratum]|nr:NUDIX hydrolase domain-like protein [Lyophyllum atratum]